VELRAGFTTIPSLPRGLPPGRRGTGVALAAALFLAGCGGMAASPTPGPIVFSARPEGAFGWQLVVVNPDGSSARRLTRYDGDVGPEWSPDGTKVLFLRTTEEEAACGLPACAQSWVIDADGRNARRLTPLDEDVEAPAWSPDGRRIAFAKRDLGRESAEGSDYEADIYVMKADGTEPTRLTDRAGWESTPSWSPDGDQIAFSTEDGEEGDIFVVNSDGSELTRLTDLPGIEIDPTWSPDGERIAFSTQWIERADVYVMNADGSDLQRLTDPAVGETSPAWSPDGDTLAFWREDDDGPAIVLVDGNGGDERVLRPSVGLGLGPVWSPDGKELAFTSDDQEGVWVMDADGGNLRRVWSAGPGGDPFGMDWAAARD
jgi:Tol biopolymer transport system component